MLSVIIATQNSERALVPTLAALVPAAAIGLISEVVVADACSRDATAEVADIAGCRFITSTKTVGGRLKDAAMGTRTGWLLFLRAGIVPQAGWIEAVESFMQEADAGENAARAATFRQPALSGLLGLVRAALGGGPTPDQGLLIARRFYESFGGHPEGADGETALLRRLGRRRMTVLAAVVSKR